jgi:hypothetical protein
MHELNIKELRDNMKQQAAILANCQILEFPVLCVLQYQYYQYCWLKNTGASSIVCFTILVLPVLLDEEY